MKTEERYHLIRAVQERHAEMRAEQPEVSNYHIVLCLSLEFKISEATIYRYLARRT